MSDDAESERLLAIASAIARGDEIAWDDERRAAGGDAALLGALEALESIAAAQRRLHETSSSELTHWGHLTLLEPRRVDAPWTCHRARDNSLAKDVTLLLAGPLAGEPASVETLLRDARRQTQLHHPNIATVYGADYAHDYVGLWMEAVQGPTLEEWVRTRGPLDASDASAIARDLCGAVAAFHHAGLAHGGVAPANVIRCDDGRIVLSASLAGGAASPASDLAGLGVTLRVLLTGAQSDEERAATADATPAPPLPRRFAPIVARALSTDAAQRFAGAADLDAALERAMRSPRFGWEWIVGFVVAALVAGAILWLTASAAP